MYRHLFFIAATACFMQAGMATDTQASVAPSTHPPASTQSADACSFQSPTPFLLPNSYSRQILERQSENRLTERAQLRKDLRIEIRQSACVDFLTTEFILLVPRGRNLQLDQRGWIGLARTTIAELKTLKPKGEYTELDDFLSRAQALHPHGGVLAVCRDGSHAGPGECSWDSMGGFVFFVKRDARGTRVSVTQYING